MPIYPYRCLNNHYIEQYFSMGSQPKFLECTCGEEAKRVFTVPQISVDNMDKIDMIIATGRNFSNKREFEAWLSSRNAHVLDDSEWQSDKEQLAEQVEFRRELEAKGINYREYLHDEKQRERKYQDEKLKSLGIKLEAAHESDFLNATEADGWVDTIEDQYHGDSYRDSLGQNITPLSAPRERVACPYSELTNGAVSDI